MDLPLGDLKSVWSWRRPLPAPSRFPSSPRSRRRSVKITQTVLRKHGAKFKCCAGGKGCCWERGLARPVSQAPGPAVPAAKEASGLLSPDSRPELPVRRGGWKNASVGGWRAGGQMVLILAIMELGTPGSRWKPRGSTWRNGASPASFFVSFASVFESEISPSGRCHIRVLRVCVSPAPSGSLPFASQTPSQFLDVSLGRSWQQHQRSPFLTLIKLSFRPETCPDPSPRKSYQACGPCPQLLSSWLRKRQRSVLTHRRLLHTLQVSPRRWRYFCLKPKVLRYIASELG